MLRLVMVVLVDWLLASLTQWHLLTTLLGGTDSDTGMESLSRKLWMVTRSKFLITGLTLTPGNSRDMILL